MGVSNSADGALSVPLVKEQTRHWAAKWASDSYHERRGGVHSKTGLGRGHFRGLIQDRPFFVSGQERLRSRDGASLQKI